MTTGTRGRKETWAPFASLRRRARGRESHVEACEAFARGDYRTAVKRFGDALDVDARNQFALCNRALARMRLGDFVDAVVDAEACVRNAPEWHKAWFRLGQAREGAGRRGEALRAYLECRRCDVDGVDAEECDGAIEALRARVESESEGKREAMRKMEEARDAEVREEDAEKARRRDERIKKWEAKRAKRKDAEERLKRELGVVGDDVRVADVHTYADEFEDSDDSALEAYDGAGRAKFIERKITDFASITRRAHTHVGAKATVDTMFEMRRYGNCQLSLNAKLEATAKFKSSADAMDECRLPYVVIPAWREASSPWPMPLARSHQDVQDSMWLLESVARTTAAAMYEHVGKSADDLHRTLDSPLFEVNGESGPRPEDVSPSALVLSNDESFVSAYGERTNALLRVDWLEAYEEEDAAADDGATLVQVTICRELAERLDGSFMLTDELDPSEREGQEITRRALTANPTMTLTDPRSDRALVQTNASSVVDIARRLREDLRAIDELRRRDARGEESLETFRLRDLEAKTASWLLRRRKLKQSSLGDRERTQLRELFDALDADGGGEVDFDEVVGAFVVVMGGSDAEAAARELFARIDVDGSGTLDFQEFTRLMSDLESAREQGSSGGDERGAIFRQAAAALQTRRCVSDFIEQWTGRDGGRAKRHAFK